MLDVLMSEPGLQCARVVTFVSQGESAAVAKLMRVNGERHLKGYYRDAVLLALRDRPALGMKDGETRNLGRFHPNRLDVLYTLMTRGGVCSPGTALEDLQSGPNGVDWLGGRWKDLGLWTPKSFFSRVEQRLIFDESGCLDHARGG
jgi:hypothetical protein